MKSGSIGFKVAKIIERVRQEGDRALIGFTHRFDGIRLSKRDLRVSRRETGAAVKEIDPALRSAIDRAAANIRAFHREELKNIVTEWHSKADGSVTGRRATPVRSVGIYVPGGRFSYPSTILMSAIPARIAGVERIAMVTPPGRLTPAVLYAARKAGVDEIYRVGGAQSIAALAFGTSTIRPVDIIVGPGNAYVNEAKRQVFGVVGIDALAGPSEVAIVAEAGIPDDYIAADLLAQVEHDPAAKAYLISDSDDVLKRLKKRIPGAVRRQVSFIRAPRGRVPGIVDRIAPEHLELLVKAPAEISKKVRNAGAIFEGVFTPTAAGDYAAGPSHVLPTGATARFSSGLSVETFLKRTSIIRFSKKRLAQDASLIERLAAAEGLPHHRRSVTVRGKRRNGVS